MYASRGKCCPFFFLVFLKDSPKLVRRRRGRLEDLVFLGDSRFFCLSLQCFASVLFRFRVCVRRFSPGKLVFFADPFVCGILRSIFGSELWFSVGVLVLVLVGASFAHVFGYFCGIGFRKSCRKNSLIVRSLLFCLSLLALLLFLFFFPGGRPGRGCPPCAVLPFSGVRLRRLVSGA